MARCGACSTLRGTQPTRRGRPRQPEADWLFAPSRRRRGRRRRKRKTRAGRRACGGPIRSRVHGYGDARAGRLRRDPPPPLARRADSHRCTNRPCDDRGPSEVSRGGLRRLSMQALSTLRTSGHGLPLVPIPSSSRFTARELAAALERRCFLCRGWKKRSAFLPSYAPTTG